MKCKHKNFTIYEHVSASTSFAFKDGKPPEDGNGWGSDPVPTGEITVCCDDCSFEQKYRHYTKAPKWVKDAWERLIEEQGAFMHREIKMAMVPKDRREDAL